MIDFDSLWNYNKPDETEQKFLEIMEKLDVEGDTSALGQLYTQLARTQSLQRKWEEAYAYLDKAKALLDQADKVTEVRYLLELGRTHNSSGNKQKAFGVFEQAWELAKNIQADGYAVDAAHMLAIVAKSSKETLDWNERAIEYAKQSSQADAQKWLGSLYNNVGWTYFAAGDHRIALDMFEKALVERKKQDNTENIRIAKWCIARTQRELGRIGTALETQLNLLAEHQQLGDEDAYVYEELAHCYSALDKIEETSKFAKLAYDLLSQDQWMIENESDRLQALKELM